MVKFGTVLETECFERLLGNCIDVLLRSMQHYRYIDDAVYEMIREACQRA